MSNYRFPILLRRAVVQLGLDAFLIVVIAIFKNFQFGLIGRQKVLVITVVRMVKPLRFQGTVPPLHHYVIPTIAFAGIALFDKKIFGSPAKGAMGIKRPLIAMQDNSSLRNPGEFL